MTSQFESFRQIGFLTIALTIALGANFAYGQWANPTVAPVGGNVSAPINVSGTNQTKPANITAWRSKAGDQMWSPWYCDENGPGVDDIPGTADDNCVDVADIRTVIDGSAPPAPSCTTIPTEVIEVWSSCSNGGGYPAACPAGYTQSNLKSGFQGSGSYDGDCVGSTRSGDSDYTMRSQLCTRTEQNYCDASTCQTYPEFSFTRTDVCGGSAANLGCPAGYDRAIAATGTCNRDGDSRTRNTVTCTLPAQTYCAP